MKQVIKNLQYEAKRELWKMQKSKMSLADRIAYEKALEKLELMMYLLDKCEIKFIQ